MESSRKIAHALAFGIFLLIAWGAVSGTGLVKPIILPAPWIVAKVIPSMVSTDYFLSDIAYTLSRVAASIGIACVIGAPIGLLLGYRSDIYALVEGPLHAFRSVPATALFPLFLIVIGVGEWSIIALATYPSLLVILVNTVSGVTLANKRRLHQAKILGLRTRELVMEVLFFEALPHIFDGIRTAVSYSLVLIVAVEMFIGIGDVGLGRKIYLYQSTYRIPETYAAIAVAATIGVGLNLAVNNLERRLLYWLPHAHGQN